jgi:sigma-B regulation protein RsbU (phosphoserine phosphatase)
VTPAPLPFGPVLGVRRGVRFEATELILAPGELILLYTDGVTEAKNGEGHFFGERRLAEVLSRSADPNRSCGETVAAIRQAVADFAGGAPQSDDIALLAFRV